MARAFLAAPAISAEQGDIRLAPHQVEAASRLLALLGEHGGAVLADATGLGKTFVAIALARLFPPALIVAPAALRGMWRESLGRTDVVARLESYEALSRGLGSAQGPALLVLDEAHHARNPRARRYEALADLAWGAKVLLLTATPIHNRGRDLRALIALFMGSRAETMTDEQLLRLIVRRKAVDSTAGSGPGLPAIARPRWLSVPADHDTLRAITALPPAVPAADGATAHALLVLGLIRAWSSSEAALREVLRRRLRRTTLLAVALESGRLPNRRELAAWPVVDGAIQLGFPGLLTGRGVRPDLEQVRSALDCHAGGVRSIIRALDASAGSRDGARVQLLASIRRRHAPTPVVAFTQFADTAAATFRACVGTGGVALVTGRGARIASGHVTIDEIVQGFDATAGAAPSPQAMPLRLLIATDVLSEGLSLRRAGVIVHLDLPWTTARLEQRVGRLRRPGSIHENVFVYAIGPPLGSRELITVVRALQRKARLSTVVTGAEELATTLPLLGQRLLRATASIARRGATQTLEDLRKALWSWSAPTKHARPAGSRPDQSGSALVLLGERERSRLIAVTSGVVSENPADLLRAVQALSLACRSTVDRDEDSLAWVESIAKSVDEWLSEKRGGEMVGPALNSPSVAHVAVLRALHERLARATRSDRVSLGPRVERCRELVNAAKGIGAELAMQRLLNAGVGADVDALEQLLGSRTPPATAQKGATSLVALLCAGPDRSNVVGYLVSSGSITAGLPHPGPPRSSNPLAAPAGA